MARRFTLASSPNGAALPSPPSAHRQAACAACPAAPRCTRHPTPLWLPSLTAWPVRSRGLLAARPRPGGLSRRSLQDASDGVRLALPRRRSEEHGRAAGVALALSGSLPSHGGERPERSLHSLPSPYRSAGDAATSTTINGICRSIWSGRGGRSSGCGARRACDVDARGAHACSTE